MLEAMACGTPVLAFGAGSVPEIVSDGVSGWICRDLDDMARRAQLPDVSPASCRAHVASRFTAAHMTRGYLEVYREAIARWRDGRAVPFGTRASRRQAAPRISSPGSVPGSTPAVSPADSVASDRGVPGHPR
jgi:hypothetical protein